MSASVFTGWHMTAILVAFFGIGCGGELSPWHVMPVPTFGGIVVENSYVASQEFNGWLDEARESEGLGWAVVTTWRPDGRLVMSRRRCARLALTAQATARHPLGRKPDRALTFDPDRPAAPTFRTRALPAGRWTLRLEVSDGTAEWRREDDICNDRAGASSVETRDQRSCRAGNALRRLHQQDRARAAWHDGVIAARVNLSARHGDGRP